MLPIRRFTVSLLLCVCASSLAGQGYRTFKSADGREMEAKIIHVNQDEVRIERKADQRNFTVPIRTFSEDDRSYIRNWDQMQRLSRDDALGIRISRSRTGKEKQESLAIKEENWKSGYAIAVSNETFGDFDDLELHYRIFKFDEKRAASSRGEGEMERKSGKFEIPKLRRDETVEHETEKFEMSASALKEGWYYTNGGRKKDKDELDGCWVRVYKDGKIVHETALPTAVMRQERWDVN
ncbi:MAG: hypothetical protein ACOCVJ_00310 [Verrucomicrobiota bacterium]